MSAVGLLYVGAVLFLNGLMLLGRIDGKSAGVFNLFIGAMQVITPFYMIFTSGGDVWTIFQASGIFLFGLTYLYVGITNLLGLDASGVGWYSLWVAILAVGYAAMNFLHFHDEKFGIIWLMWSFLWTLFFVLLALKRDIGAFVGWVTLIQAWVTATIPAFLILIGEWERIGAGVTEAAAGLTVVAYGIAYALTRWKAPRGVEVSS